MRLEERSNALDVCAAVDSWPMAHGFCGRTFDLSSGCPEGRMRFESKTELKLLLLQQEHGAEIVELDAGVLNEERLEQLLSADSLPRADAWLVRNCGDAKARFACGIRTADCVPVLIWSAREQVMAAAHCGWRGTAAGLLVRLIERLCGGASPCGLQLAIGPSAGGCCYTVGEDVEKACKQSLMRVGAQSSLPLVIKRMPGGQMRCSLRDLLVIQAVSCGISKGQLAVSDRCTICDLRFFSYRREKDQAGRQLSFISPAPA